VVSARTAPFTRVAFFWLESCNAATWPSRSATLSDRVRYCMSQSMDPPLGFRHCSSVALGHMHAFRTIALLDDCARTHIFLLAGAGSSLRLDIISGIRSLYHMLPRHTWGYSYCTCRVENQTHPLCIVTAPAAFLAAIGEIARPSRARAERAATTVVHLRETTTARQCFTLLPQSSGIALHQVSHRQSPTRSALCQARFAPSSLLLQIQAFVCMSRSA
jgi:hypothetical protein